MKGLKVTGIIAVILAAIFLGFTLTVDGIVESAIEDSGSELLQIEVEVDDVDISIFGGTGSMDGFKVYNPEGFSDEPAISFNEIEIGLSLSGLTKEAIEIDRIYVGSPKIFVEQQGAEINLRALSSNISGDSDEDSKPIIIREFVLEEGTIVISSELEKERNIEATLDRLVLNDIGASGSDTIQDALQQILEPVIRNAISKAVQSGLMDKLENTVKDAVDEVIDF